MGLFNRLKKQKPLEEREFVFNKDLLRKKAAKLSRVFYGYRKDEGHQKFVQYIETAIDLEMLEMTHTKELSSEAYAYHRGRIDSLRSILSYREKYILDGERAKKIKDSKEKTENSGMRRYATPPTAAGLS